MLLCFLFFSCYFFAHAFLLMQVSITELPDGVHGEGLIERRAQERESLLSAQNQNGKRWV